MSVWFQIRADHALQINFVILDDTTKRTKKLREIGYFWKRWESISRIARLKVVGKLWFYFDYLS